MAYSKELQKELKENPFLTAQLKSLNIIYIPPKIKKHLSKKLLKFMEETKHKL